MVEWILQLKQSPSTCIMVPSAPPFPPMHSPLLQFLWFFSHHLISHPRPIWPPIYSSLENDGLDHKPSHNRHTFLLSSFQMLQVKGTSSTPVSWTKICCISWLSSLILHIRLLPFIPKRPPPFEIGVLLYAPNAAACNTIPPPWLTIKEKTNRNNKR